MLKGQIKPGTEYALREKRLLGAPLQRVRILEHVRGTKWKAEWIEPNPGLTDYVESGQLLVPWKEHKAFLREEAAATVLREHNESRGYKKGSPVDDALPSGGAGTNQDAGGDGSGGAIPRGLRRSTGLSSPSLR